MLTLITALPKPAVAILDLDLFAEHFEDDVLFACSSTIGRRTGGIAITHDTVALLGDGATALRPRASVRRWFVSIAGDVCTLTLDGDQRASTRISAHLAPAIVSACTRLLGPASNTAWPRALPDDDAAGPDTGRRSS